MTRREFKKFAEGTLWNYQALTAWLRRGGIKPATAARRRRKIDLKARAIMEVSRLASQLPGLQQELNNLIEDRSRAATFFSTGHLSNGKGEL